MAKYKIKIMNEAQIAEVEELWKDHGEALAAFGIEAANAWREGQRHGYMLIAASFCIGACGAYIGKKVYHKLKEEKKPTEKPGRVWEA